MEKSENIHNVNNNNSSQKQSFKEGESQNAMGIFELLKNIKDANTNEELTGYFQFTRFYGLLDPDNEALLEELEQKQLKAFKILVSGASITLLFGFYFYRRSYYNTALLGICFGVPPLLWINTTLNNEVNFMLLDMKDKYIYKVDRFFKEDKNPTILNPNFLTEDLVDPDLKLYQDLLKRKAIKKF